MTSQALSDLFDEYAVVSTEVEHGRLAGDAPQVRDLADRMAAALATASRTAPIPTPVPEPV